MDRVSRSVRAVWVAGLVSLLLVVGAPPAQGAFRRHVCRRPARATVLASNREAVLFWQRGDRFYGCLKALGLTRLLLNAHVEFAGLVALRLAGRFAVLEPEWFNQYASWEKVTLYDLSSGKATDLAEVAWGPSADPGIDGLDSLALDASGFAAWRKISGPTPHGLTAVTCPSASLCVAGDYTGNIFTSSNPLGGPDAWSRTGVLAGLNIQGISCPSVSMCVATDSDGNILASTDPTGGASAWTKTRIVTDLYNDAVGVVSCPSVSFCVVGDLDDSIFASADPTGGKRAWTKVRIERGYNQLNAVSCPSISLCVATDTGGNILTSTHPTGGPRAWRKTTLEPGNWPGLGAVSCPSASMCIAADYLGQIWASTHPTRGKRAWRKTKLEPLGPPTGVSLDGLFCPSISLCVAGDSAGNILTSTNPTGGQRAWTRAPADQGTPYASAIGPISCPSVSLCVAGNGFGDILTSTNPTGGANAWSSAPVDVPDGISEQLYAHDDQGTRVVDTAPPGQGNSISNVALASRVLNWTHDGAQRQLQLR